MTLLYAGLGAALGSVLRYLAGHLLDHQEVGGRMPWGTLLVNLAGSFLLGLLNAMALDGDAMALLGAGFCGGLTTFSAFAVQTHDAGPRLGTAYLLLTVPPALAACAAGFWLAA